MSADDRWARALARGAARAAQAQHDAHEEMRAVLKQRTETAVAKLQALRVRHAGDGHFVNNMFVPAQVSRRDLALAFQQPEGVKRG